MSNLVLKGLTEVEGMKFHDIEGGFGEDKKAMLVKDIANIHTREVKKVNELINNNRKRFKDDIDIIDLKTGLSKGLVLQMGFTNAQYGNANNIYLLSERGYAKLLKILEDDIAWEQYEKLVDGYFNMRKTIKSEQCPTCIEDIMIAQLQEMKALKNEVQTTKAGLEEVKKETKGIRDIVAINSTDWKSDCKSIIVKIAQKQNINYSDVYKEAYSALEKRAVCQLSIRKTNIQKKMALEGVCKSKIDKVTKLDAIEADKRLVECFLAIVKEMAIKYGV